MFFDDGTIYGGHLYRYFLMSMKTKMKSAENAGGRRFRVL